MKIMSFNLLYNDYGNCMFIQRPHIEEDATQNQFLS